MSGWSNNSAYQKQGETQDNSGKAIHGGSILLGLCAVASRDDGLGAYTPKVR